MSVKIKRGCDGISSSEGQQFRCQGFLIATHFWQLLNCFHNGGRDCDRTPSAHAARIKGHDFGPNLSTNRPTSMMWIQWWGKYDSVLNIKRHQLLLSVLFGIVLLFDYQQEFCPPSPPSLLDIYIYTELSGFIPFERLGFKKRTLSTVILHSSSTLILYWQQCLWFVWLIDAKVN